MADPLTLRLLRYLPKNLISRVFGWLARRQRPRFLVRRIKCFWAVHFGVRLDEAERPLEQYPSLQAFFTRKLKAGVRPLAGGENVLIHPVDGTLGAFGVLRGDRLLQAKGMEYSGLALLGSEAAARPFRDGAFATFYLSPRDYHRIHVPVAGEVRRSLYEPGTLWPVNPPAVRTIPALFAVNERVTACIESSYGPVAVVMVGATNVGSIRLAYGNLVTNQGAPRMVLEHDPPIPVVKGAHIGTFELGSTVILLVGNASFRWHPSLREGHWFPMGAALGRFA